MKIVSNENNLAPLKERIVEYAGKDTNGGGEILIASGWIQSEYCQQLFPDDVGELLGQAFEEAKRTGKFNTSSSWTKPRTSPPRRW